MIEAEKTYEHILFEQDGAVAVCDDEPTEEAERTLSSSTCGS